MKNLFRLFFVTFSLFLLVSCGGNGNDSAQENESNSDGDSVAVSLRVARDADGSCTGMELDCLSQEIAAIAFQIKNGKGEIVFQKSVARADLKNLKEITGIKNADNATLVVSVFLGNDMNTPKWQGRVTSLKFEKGKTTKATVLLYPAAPQPKEVAMPEKLTTARFGHTSTVLGDGRVLVAGGFASCGDNGKCAATESVEIIDIESGKIETLAPMTAKRAMHTAVTLNDGSILFIGGVQSFSAAQQEESFQNYPVLPYSLTGAVTTVERYMPSYPKFNMKENNLGTPTANYTEQVSVPEGIAFLTFQSILAKRTSETGIDVFLVGGVEEVDENKVPSAKTYKFTITDSTAEDGSVSIGGVTEFKETSSAMLLPALAYSSGAILAVGGRPVVAAAARDETNEETTEETTEETSEETPGEETADKTVVVASLISENESRDITGDIKNNIFFTNSTALDDALYTFAGMPNKKAIENAKENGVIRKWNLSDGSMQVFNKTENMLRSWNGNIAFAETLYDSRNNRFIVIGGTDAEDLYQVINATDFELYGKDPTHKMSDKRIMPKASVVPAGTIGDRPILVITGGTSALNSTGSAANTIKINIL